MIELGNSGLHSFRRQWEKIFSRYMEESVNCVYFSFVHMCGANQFSLLGAGCCNIKYHKYIFVVALSWLDGDGFKHLKLWVFSNLTMELSRSFSSRTELDTKMGNLQKIEQVCSLEYVFSKRDSRLSRRKLYNDLRVHLHRNIKITNSIIRIFFIRIRITVIFKQNSSSFVV